MHGPAGIANTLSRNIRKLQWDDQPTVVQQPRVQQAAHQEETADRTPLLQELQEH